MILFSILAMRDLIRNYKLIIAGKNQPDSDSEIFLSSSSSVGYNSNADLGEPEIFSQDHCSSESEAEILEKSPKTSNMHNVQNSTRIANKNENDCVQNDSFYDNLYEHSTLQEICTETTKLVPSKRTANKSIGSNYDLKSSKRKTNNSLITIFAIWNTTMGSSLLAMGWGMEKAGLFPGIFINVFIAGICLYTAYVLLQINDKHGVPYRNFEVTDLCRILIGQWAEILSKIFSLIVLIGGDVVYWILMSNFMYNFVVFLYGNFSSEKEIEAALLCPKEIIFSNSTGFVQNTTVPSTFEKVWDLYSTVPIFLAVMMFPILNMKSPTFFAKFNSLGTLSVTYLIIFVAVKSISWGINIDNWAIEFKLKSTFCVLSGMLTMSYFIHNIIISIMRHNKHQEHNGRDLSIAFSLVTFTYLFLGIAFYITFPMKKSCIEDNLLNNFSNGDTMALIARVLLFFQLFTVFPFITLMLRNEILSCINVICRNERNEEFSYAKAILINFNVVFICIMFACFMPKIGTLIRYTGALSGLIYIFIMPSLLKMASLKIEGSLTLIKRLILIGIMVLGVLNLISQFFITE